MLEQMHGELAAEGVEAAFVSINAFSGLNHQENLIAKCTFPLFQDTEEVDAWGLHDGKKDDIYIYDAAGKLAAFLPINGSIETNLSTDEGYANLKNAILSVLP